MKTVHKIIILNIIGGLMRTLKYLIVVVLTIFSFSSLIEADDTTFNVKAQVYFSPNGGSTDAIVKTIDNAKSEILIQAYSFTSREIAKSLVNAYKRGVRVEAILDKSNMTGQYSALDYTSRSGIITYIDSAHEIERNNKKEGIAHNKIIIIDKDVVITGSFNFTYSVERYNAENLLILHSKELAKEYISNWEIHQKHSQIYGE